MQLCIATACACVLLTAPGGTSAQTTAPAPAPAPAPVPAPAPAIVQPGAPGLPSHDLPPTTHAQPMKRNPADVAFMQGMIMHHSQAVIMTSWIPSHTTNPAVRLLGARISRSQTAEMEFMRRWLHDRGEPTSLPMPPMSMSGASMPLMPGMLSAAQMTALHNARGKQFDHLFLTGMIQHHGGALTMVKDLFDAPGGGQDADLFDFATDADNTQRAEIRIMQGLLEKEQ